MKRKKDRSGKVALIASLVIIFLVGVCVFSLYSIKEPEFLNGLGLFIRRAVGTETGKHLVREDIPQDAENEDDSYSAPIVWETDEGQSVVVLGQQLTPEEEWQNVNVEEQQPAAPAEQQPAAPAEQQPAAPAEQQPAAPTEQQPAAPTEQQSEAPTEQPTAQPASEEQPAAQPEVKAVTVEGQKDEIPAEQETIIAQGPKEETPVEETKTVEADPAKNVQDVSGTALSGTADQNPVTLEVQDSVTDTFEVQETALMAVDDTAAQTEDYDTAAVDDTAVIPEETYEAPDHQVVRDAGTEAAVVDDGWRFNYDTEEWYHVDDASQAEAPVQPEALQPIVDNSGTVEETGEWLFDEQTEEWYYAEVADDGTDDTVTDDTAADNDTTENKTDEDDSDPEDRKETGEWKFNEDTGEWYYVIAESEEKSDDDTKKDKESAGEWLFDEETGEWYFEENAGAAGGDEEENQDEQTEDTQDEESTGAWLFNEETGEWYYDENAVTDEDGEDEDADSEDEDTDDQDDAADEEEESIEGEWIYDEETHEWIYVEGKAEKEDKEEKSTEKETAEKETVEEVAEETSLGEEIVNYAMGYVGVTPYVWAGNSLTGGTDCSGFVHLIYDQFGIYASHASMAYDGGEFGTVIGLDELQPGDIVVYGAGAHVAIYAGDGYVVHCSSPENGTVYWKMDYRSDASWGLRILE